MQAQPSGSHNFVFNGVFYFNKFMHATKPIGDTKYCGGRMCIAHRGSTRDQTRIEEKQMSDQDKISVLQGMLRQVEREAAATEIYLKGQIRQLKERTADEQRAFKGGWVARDSGGSFSEIDEWYATWVEDEERKL